MMLSFVTNSPEINVPFLPKSGNAKSAVLAVARRADLANLFI